MKQMPFPTMGRAIALALCVLACGSCGTAMQQGHASSYLVIDVLSAASGAEPDKFGTQLHSDVQTIVTMKVQGVDQLVPTIYSDMGKALFRFSMKDPTNPAGASTTNEITLTGYHVNFVRADGRNTPGVDVPWPFDGAATGTVKVGGTLELGFTLVRAQAKAEAPLITLAGNGGAIFISSIAEITFWGRDQAGNQVSALAKISVLFSDWADPQ